MSPQTGLPHNNRVGDFDPFCLPLIMQAEGKSLQQVLDTLAEKSGLLGLSGISGDVRDLEDAAAAGNGRARLALDVFIAEIRRHLGGMSEPGRSACNRRLPSSTSGARPF